MTSTPRLYVGRLATTTRDRDLADKFSKYGRIREIEMKIGFAYVEFEHVRDAEDAMRALDEKEVDGL